MLIWIKEIISRGGILRPVISWKQFHCQVSKTRSPPEGLSTKDRVQLCLLEKKKLSGGTAQFPSSCFCRQGNKRTVLPLGALPGGVWSLAGGTGVTWVQDSILPCLQTGNAANSWDNSWEELNLCSLVGKEVGRRKKKKALVIWKYTTQVCLQGQYFKLFVSAI